jgi:hypothetical protein
VDEALSVSNERLRGALTRAGTAPRDLARAVDVDLKTVERWLGGRRPFPRHRRAVADLLLQEESYLWPGIANERRMVDVGRAELVTLYPHRSAVPTELWLDLLSNAARQIDVLAYAALFLPELAVDVVNALVRKAKEGATVRIALGDAASGGVRLRGEEEGIGDGMAARIAMSLVHLEPLVGREGIGVRLHGTTLYNSIFRFDDEILVNTHLFGAKAYQNPVLHLRRVEGGTLFRDYVASFDRVWGQSSPYAR